MPHPMLLILLEVDKIAKENQTGPVACCWCNNKINFIKYGSYHRYGFAHGERIKIQRYLCKHDRCRRTFSILPHPFLRITRITLCMLTCMMQLLDQQLPIAQIGRQLGLTRSVIKGVIKKGRQVLEWLDQEAQAEPSWAPSPCLDPGRHWSDFIRMFAAKFYPKRYAGI